MENAKKGSEKVDQPKNLAEGIQQPNHGRTERRLARGLEDVSYLFLSEAADEPAAKGEERDHPAGQVRSQLAASAVPVVLHPYSALNRDQLIALLHDNTAVLEEGMRAIDVNIPCGPGSPIDLLAVDSAAQLTIIDLDACINDGLLLRGIGHFDWIVRNLPIIRRMYHGQVINLSSQPRLFMVAPHFSPLLRCVANRIASPQIGCFRYRAVVMPSGVGVFFERYAAQH